MAASSTSNPRRPAPLLAAVVLIVAACGTSVTPSPTATSTPAPTASGTPADPSAVYAAIRTSIEQIRGLQPTQAIEPTLIDEATLRANLEAAFNQSYPAAETTSRERFLRAMGLLPAGTSLRDLLLKLQGDQVAGYYSPEDKALFVVSRSGEMGPIERATYAHEFVHQLQDQHFDLHGLGLETKSQADLAAARLALVEGDATFAQTEWMLTSLSGDDLARMLAEAGGPASLASLMAAPAIIRETLLFSYTAGNTFVGALETQGGNAAVDAAFADPPNSTEQILHPEKYAAREAATNPLLDAGRLAAALGSGWSVGLEDTLGEFQLRIWLRESGVAAAAAATAAAGWGGDRVVLLDGPGGGWALELVTTWDTPADAAEADAALRAAVEARPNATVIGPVGQSITVVFGADAAAVAMLAGQVPGGG
jgi:hypothetical protein